jgi:hypothetical protein
MTPKRIVVLVFILGAFCLCAGLGIAGLREASLLLAGV